MLLFLFTMVLRRVHAVVFTYLLLLLGHSILCEGGSFVSTSVSNVRSVYCTIFFGCRNV